MTGTPTGMSGAWAAGIAVLVNDEPITDYDVQQRMKLTALSTRKPQNAKMRQEVIDELIDERLILQDAKKLNITISKAQINGALNNMAQRSGRNAAQLTQLLRQMGVNVSTLEARIAAQMAWRDVIQARFRRNVRVREQDIDQFLNTLGDKRTATRYEYDIKAILLLTGNNTSQAALSQRRAEATRIASRIRDCGSLTKLVTSVRDAVVRDLGRRSSEQLPAAEQEMFAKLEVNGVTPPRLGKDGVEMFVICAKQEVVDDGAARLEAQNKLANDEFSALAKRHMRDLRQSAVIERR